MNPFAESAKNLGPKSIAACMAAVWDQDHGDAFAMERYQLQVSLADARGYLEGTREALGREREERQRDRERAQKKLQEEKERSMRFRSLLLRLPFEALLETLRPEAEEARRLRLIADEASNNDAEKAAQIAANGVAIEILYWLQEKLQPIHYRDVDDEIPAGVLVDASFNNSDYDGGSVVPPERAHLIPELLREELETVRDLFRGDWSLFGLCLRIMRKQLWGE